MDDEVRKHDEVIVDKAVADLLKHFDAVQVFVTRQEPDQETLVCSVGAGNWYARFGMIHEWLENGGIMQPWLPGDEMLGDGDEDE